MRRTGLALGVALGFVSIHAAQAPFPLAFDAASVKVNKSGDWRKAIGPAPGGRFEGTNTPFRDLVGFAFGLPQDSLGFRVVGGPTWIDQDRFDIVAKVDGSWTRQQMSEMLRALLVDRFRLAAHSETRELPTYTLVVASNRRLRLRRSEVDEAACQARRAAIQRREAVPPTPPGAIPICGTGRITPGTISAVGSSMDSLASSLGQFVGRTVTNATALTGLYDFTLTWTPEQMPQRPPDAPPLNIDPNGPSIFTALQEQLGLKLESARGQVDVVVIDRVEHPTED
jgi:uncharacterized protein (TIGR03435 family)